MKVYYSIERNISSDEVVEGLKKGNQVKKDDPVRHAEQCSSGRRYIK